MSWAELAGSCARYQTTCANGVSTQCPISCSERETPERILNYAGYGPSNGVLAVDRYPQHGGTNFEICMAGCCETADQTSTGRGRSPPPELDQGKTAPVKDKTPPYPAGTAFRPDEIQRARGDRPRSIEGGESLCWDYSARAGCLNTESSGSRGKREVVKLRGHLP